MKFFFIYVFILALLLNTKVQSQSLQTSDSLVEKTIQKVLVSNLPVFLTKNNEGGFFLVKMEISNSDSIPVIQLLNESRSEALQYFKNNFSKKCIFEINDIFIYKENNNTNKKLNDMEKQEAQSVIFTEKQFKYTDEKGGFLQGPGVDFSKDFKIFNMQKSSGEVMSIEK